MVDGLKKVKSLTILDLIIFTILDASQTQVGLGICETLLNVRIEVDGERVAAGLKTIAVRLQYVDRLEVDFFVLEDHHVADIAVSHCADSVVEKLKKVKENELSMMGFEPTLTDPAGYPVLTAALHTQKLVPPRGFEPLFSP